ncbi:MAG: hypothetical protein JXA96_11680 [Sedimentisphaerales bacterium]|nr:hypothetical protein [Sedimentisphaerales bacterium]
MNNHFKILNVIFIPLFFITLVFNPELYANSNKGYSEEEIIERIDEAERKINTIEVHLNYSFPNGSTMTADWGYQGGKEYLWGKQNNPATVKDGTDVAENNRTFQYSFNGEKFITFKHNTLQSQRTQAVISDFINSRFSSILRPTAFLGYDISSGPTTLSGTLRSAKTVNIRENTEMIDGHPCIIIEAIGISLPDRPLVKDALIWIDTERDFRPLKIEHYESIGGNNRWKVLQCVEDDIRLKQIDDIWIPVSGKRTHYKTVDIKLPEGMTEEYYKNLPPETRQEYLIRKVEPSEYGTRFSEINEDTFKINKAIDPTKFDFELPFGCEVYDSFVDILYTVGNLGSGQVANYITLEGLSEQQNNSTDQSYEESEQNSEEIISSIPSTESTISNSNIQAQTEINKPNLKQFLLKLTIVLLLINSVCLIIWIKFRKPTVDK